MFMSLKVKDHPYNVAENDELHPRRHGASKSGRLEVATQGCFPAVPSFYTFLFISQ